MIHRRLCVLRKKLSVCTDRRRLLLLILLVLVLLRQLLRFEEI
jgi:hypothetical protein